MKYLLDGEQTARLTFRTITPAHFNAWLPFFNNPAIYPFLFLDAAMTPRELCSFWFDKIFSRYDEDRGGLNALIDNATGELIGQCGLLVQNIQEEMRLEIGYSLLPHYEGKGFATEAAQACKAFGFKNNYDAHFTNDLISMIHVNNRPSVQVALNNKMKLQKTFQAANGEHFNVYGITRECWEKDA